MDLVDIIDNILLLLGNKILLPSESLKLYHSSPVKFEKLNNIGNWFSPIRIKEKSNYYAKNKIYTIDKPLWYNGYDFKFINTKQLKLLSINTYEDDINSSKLNNMINIINDNIKLKVKDYENYDNYDNDNDNDNDKKRFLQGQEQDPEYLLAYYLCKYSSFDGWITSTTNLGYFMLKKDSIKKLKLLSVSEPSNNNNIIMYYNSKQWTEQFTTYTQL